MIKLKPYKKYFEYSYAFGAFAVYELLLSGRENAKTVYIHSDYTEAEKLSALCATQNTQIIYDDKIFKKLTRKENTLVFAHFMKYTCHINNSKPHICLVNPCDMGNLGCIFRTALAFGVTDIAIITPAADVFDPRCVRASMGGLFRANFSMFDSFDNYRETYPEHEHYPFMTTGANLLSTAARFEKEARPEKYSLIFGGEAAGLPGYFANIGKAVRIPQTSAVDSLNLSVAVGIGLYEFCKDRAE